MSSATWSLNDITAPPRLRHISAAPRHLSLIGQAGECLLYQLTHFSLGHSDLERQAKLLAVLTQVLGAHLVEQRLHLFTARILGRIPSLLRLISSACRFLCVRLRLIIVPGFGWLLRCLSLVSTDILGTLRETSRSSCSGDRENGLSLLVLGTTKPVSGSL